MHDIYISGTGVWTPQHKVSNQELVESFNEYVRLYNIENEQLILDGSVIALEPSSEEFIAKASGILNRYVIEKDSLLNPNIMKPMIEPRDNDALSVSAEISVIAAQEALKNAGLQASEIDAVIVSTANLQRAYPAIAIEVQNALGIEGYAYDMMVGCSSTTFGISNAYSDIAAGKASKILVINPEITSAHNNYKNRDSHFIFGDVCTATVVEKNSTAPNKFKILGAKLKTQFSNNIRNNFGFMNAIENKEYTEAELLFIQNGRSVFKEVMPMVASLITDHLSEHSLLPEDVEQYWLHQANINMNTYVIKKLLGDDFPPERAPNVLEEYANTGSAGSLIAFHKYNHLEVGQKGIICSFGAGYSICSILVERA
ncbi:MAG: beta-ketoacyl-ACP synthase III [Gammaproteobacteria bacterium]